MRRRIDRSHVPLRAGLLALAAVALAGFVAAPASAQFGGEGPSILSLLPSQGTLEIGSETTGELSEADYVADGRRVRAYSFEGPQGAPVTIDLISDDFDSYLYLLGPDGHEVESDDDSGGAWHARISTFLSEGGRYTVVVSSLSGSTGAFTLRTDDQQHPPASGDCGGGGFANEELLAVLTGLESSGSLTLGDEVTGTLGEGSPQRPDGSYAAAYEIAGTPGETVVVDLTSRAFDTLLYVVDPRGENYTSDDDSGGACNSRISVTLDMQPHTLVVSSFGSGGGGEFTLKVSSEAGPRSTDDCPGMVGLDPR